MAGLTLYLGRYEQFVRATVGLQFEPEKYYVGHLIYFPKESKNHLFLQEVKGNSIAEVIRNITVGMPDDLIPSPFTGTLPKNSRTCHEGLFHNEIKTAKRALSARRKVYRQQGNTEQNDKTSKAESQA